jgi:hypothetical protein
MGFAPGPVRARGAWEILSAEQVFIGCGFCMSGGG